MLKFFRRIRQKLIEEGKLKRYLIYASGEILLVMIGILLALQINNWNDQRKALVKEKILLSQLEAEFLENKAQLKVVEQKDLETFSYLQKIGTFFPIDPDKVDIDTMRWLINKTFPFETFNPSNAIINSISNNGSFEIISNDHLRKKLIVWNSDLEDYLEREKAMMKFLDEYYRIYFMNLGLFTTNFLEDERVDNSFLGSPVLESYLNRRGQSLRFVIYWEGTEETSFEKLSKLMDEIITLIKSNS